MRMISETNSRKTVDPVFRRKYAREAGMDEILFYSGWRITDKGPQHESPGIVEQPREWFPQEVHHIGHRGAKRDWRTNLIYIPRMAHTLIHSGRKGEPVYGQILCIYSKLLKADAKTYAGELKWPCEFDLQLLDECFGQSVLAFCEQAQVPAQLESVREECVERLAKLASELREKHG